MADREIVHRIPVQPGLNVTVDDGWCILLELTTPDGGEVIARSFALSDGDSVQQAINAARTWVTGASRAAGYERMTGALMRTRRPGEQR